MAPTPPVPVQIYNLTRSHLSLTNTSHAFLDPVAVRPSSLGPLAYLPSTSSAALDLVITLDRGRKETRYALSLSKKGKQPSWRRSGWEQVDVVQVERAAGEASSSTSDDTLDGSGSSKLTLKAFRTKEKDGSQKLLLMELPPLDSWMSELSDSYSLGDVAIPGTHQSTALYGWPVSQCQQPSTPLDVQLREGLRFLDVRLAYKDGKLIAYHGILTQRSNFIDLLQLIVDFLGSPASSRETIILSIQQENASTPLFLSLLRSLLLTHPRSLYHLSNTIPLLADVRGKIVLFSRFGGQKGDGWEDIGGMGIHPTGWKDSAKEGFETVLPEVEGESSGKGVGGWTLGIQDWYNISTVLSIPEKTYQVQQLLATQSALPHHVPLAFCSASAFPLACPVTVARGFGFGTGWFGVEGVNGRMGRWLTSGLAENGRATEKGEGKVVEEGEGKLEGKKADMGWVLFDFYRSEPGLVELVLAYNFV